MEISDLISHMVKDRTNNLLLAAEKKSERFIDDFALEDLFVIDMETETVEEITSAYIPAKKKQENKPEKKPAVLPKTKTTTNLK
ncbi:MAG: hypothetical protein ABIK92_17095 [Pseudomonadota bacterium]